MRLTKEVTEDLVKEVAGEDTIKLVGLLKSKENISEFKLAEKLRLTVNNVRNMLYRLQAHNLVTSTRKKDKKKGWYVYYWTFNSPQARSLVTVVKQKKLEQLKKRLEIETQQSFYACPENCTRFKIENAMEHDFKCPECGTILNEEDNLELISKIKERVAELEKELTEKPKVIRVASKIKPRKKTKKKKIARKVKKPKRAKRAKKKPKRAKVSRKKAKSVRKLRKKPKKVKKPIKRKRMSKPKKAKKSKFKRIIKSVKKIGLKKNKKASRKKGKR